MIVSGYTEMQPFLPAVEMKSASTTIFNDALEVAQDDLVATIIGTDMDISSLFMGMVPILFSLTAS